VFKSQNLLITGGTGSFGKKFVSATLNKFSPKKIIILSRDEMKQWHMAKEYENDNRIRFLIGDVRDRERMYRALNNVDVVVHAAATKIVPTAEYDPFECIKTNVNGAMNVIDACIDNGVKKVIALSTDKASSPINLYGATKLTSDKLFISANNYSGKEKTRFSIVRYGNVIGSRGSLIPFLMSLKESKYFPITDERMTRFMITLEEGIQLVWKAFSDMKGGEIYVKKIPSMKVTDIARAVSEEKKFKIIGVRPGEKLHEQMISVEDSETTYDHGTYYKVYPNIHNWEYSYKLKKAGKKVKQGFVYSSDNNKDWMTIKHLRSWIIKNKKMIGNI
tara:strand:+ start:501 stop:1499 length:999 start_codon:yes stop_codon:yes gene_type:complete